MPSVHGNLVSKISDHLPQFLTVDNLKVYYKVLNYYKNDFSKFDEEKFINDFLLLDWNKISVDYMFSQLHWSKTLEFFIYWC